MLKKVFLAIECADEKQRDEAQLVLNEISNMRIIDADKLVKAYPMFKAREAEIRQLFAIVSQNGVKGLLSMQGASLLTQLMRK
jgi:hypothetical protein